MFKYIIYENERLTNIIGDIIVLVWLEQVLGVESVAFFHHTLIIFIFLRYLFLHIVLFVYAKQKNES